MKYQAFISFKNTDQGEYTADKKICEALYQYLSEKGIKTFYSNVSLLEFGEAAYKEVIDDALKTIEKEDSVRDRLQHGTSLQQAYAEIGAI